MLNEEKGKSKKQQYYGVLHLYKDYISVCLSMSNVTPEVSQETANSEGETAVSEAGVGGTFSFH